MTAKETYQLLRSKSASCDEQSLNQLQVYTKDQVAMDYSTDIRELSASNSKLPGTGGIRTFITGRDKLTYDFIDLDQYYIKEEVDEMLEEEKKEREEADQNIVDWSKNHFVDTIVATGKAPLTLDASYEYSDGYKKYTISGSVDCYSKGEIDDMLKDLEDDIKEEIPSDVVASVIAESGSDILVVDSPKEAVNGDVTVKYSIDEDVLEEWLKKHGFDPSSVDSGVTSVIASKIGDSETQSILNISPTSRSDDAATGDATIGIGINADALEAWLKEHDFGPSGVDTGVTSVIAKNLGEDDDTQAILKLSPLNRSDSDATGAATIGIGVDKDALNTWINKYIDITTGVTSVEVTSNTLKVTPTGAQTGKVSINLEYTGGSSEGNSSNIWFGCAETSLITSFNIKRSALYPSDEDVAPSIGDLVFMTAVRESESTSGEYICIGQGIYCVSSINGEYYLLTRCDDSMWGFSSGSGSGAVDSVLVLHLSDDVTGILTIDPTTAQTGTVVFNLGIDEDALKKYINEVEIGLKYYSENTVGNTAAYPSAQIDCDADRSRTLFLMLANPTDSSNTYLLATVSSNSSSKTIKLDSTGFYYDDCEVATQCWVSDYVTEQVVERFNNIWFATVTSTLISDFMVERQYIYPNTGTISTGDIVFISSVSSLDISSPTCNSQGIYYVYSINGDYYEMKHYDNSLWLFNTGSSSGGGAVDSVKISRYSGDTNNILYISPTSAQTGDVEVVMGVDESKLGDFIDDHAIELEANSVLTGVELSSSTYTVPSTTLKLITGTITRSRGVNIYRPTAARSTWAGHEIHMIFKAEVDTTVSFGSGVVVTDGQTSISLSADEYIEISMINDGSTVYVRTGVGISE